MGPLKSYQQQIDNGTIKKDELQKKVVLAFEELYTNLTQKRSRWFFKKKPCFHGLYIYGSVGRGKTFLMDLFVDCLDSQIVKRQHFHNFMRWLHQQLRQIKNQQNPIDIVISDLSQKTQVLCLDEFLVNDITDAMLLAEILFAMKKHHICLVTTSNVNPVHLYKGGLQRERFMPSIDWMQNEMEILQLDGNYDFRTAQSSQSEKWLTPISDSNQTLFESRFSQLIAADNIHLSPITVNKRTVEVIKRSDNHIMLEFEVLCMQPRNADDYIKLAEKYQSLFIVINHEINREDRNTARRFITLVDVMYDTQTPMYVLSAVPYEEIYQGDDLAFEMQRTISRLTEQSQ